jgi:hypothetical protein
VELTGAEAVDRLAALGGLVHMRWSQGELGRPRDNLYRVTFVAARPHKLLIECDEQVLAVLTEPRLARASDAEVVIDYDQLTMDWQGYGDMTPHPDSFARGQFTIDRQGA